METTQGSERFEEPTDYKGFKGRLYRVKRWMYRDGRPNLLARAMNHVSVLHFSSGILAPRNWMTLEVPGRRTGRLISLPVAVADHQGERYLVSMLGEEANWVRNVRAAGGRAVLRHRDRETVRLEEVDANLRAPILRRYLDCAPGARPHFPVDRRAPLDQFERIAARFPVFHITSERSERTEQGARASNKARRR
ncbi:nitroreductase/quinone reductase family protein [Sphaerisporangium dianthi]|uniref:Nitroreductase/quinone reductase family protein n=1 Tax=Sphaerisporangium dianthi TaxID=1436120 RepID=A0ABV9CB12_9ACTN